MTTLQYEHSPGQWRYWNLDWFLRVDFRRETKPDRFWVEITTAIPPGPKTQVGGMMLAKNFITITLGDEEARQFAREYQKQTGHDSRQQARAQPRADSTATETDNP